MLNQKIDCGECARQHSSVFCKAKNMAELDDSKITSIYKKGQTVFNEGTYPFGLYCINSGKIKISRNGDDGREIIIRLAKAGDLIGYKALLSGQKYTASAVALDDCTVCFVPKESFLSLLKADPDLSLGIMGLISMELRKAETKVAHLAQKPVRERLAETLLFLKETYGVEEDHQTLSVQLSREEIANVVGTATESIIRLLSEFRKDGIVKLEGRRIIIIDEHKLLRTANLQD